MSKQIYITPVTDVHDSDLEGVGTIRWDGNKAYKYVVYHGGTGNLDIAAGDAVFYTADTGYEAHQVRQDFSDISDSVIGAGVINVAIDISTFTGNTAYCWMQIKGVATLSLDPEASTDGSPVTCNDGDPVRYGVSDGAVARINTVNDVDADAVNTMGYMVDDSAKIILLDCPF